MHKNGLLAELSPLKNGVFLYSPCIGEKMEGIDHAHLEGFNKK